MYATIEQKKAVEDSYMMWIDPVRVQLNAVTSGYYPQWRDYAESHLLTCVGTVEEAEDVVHEAMVELLESVQDGYAFESEDKMNMYIKRSIALICHVVETGQHWVAS
ncbi:MAG: hypothetical protein GY845_27260 [Planctomycetes bacterium]|nr:hypothetical protein [Planctomycetota bacterium]